MKVLLFFVFFITGRIFSQGDCNTAYQLTLDGVCRTYNTSLTTGSALHCTANGYNGQGRITFFSFTTNSTAECVSVYFQTQSLVTAEVLLYESCNGTPLPINGVYVHNMCFDIGRGYWAQNLFNSLQPNTTYWLRIRTEQGYTGSIDICAKYNTPINNLCSGAIPISTTILSDNNACHLPADQSLATQLCATTLENTAWYKFTVDQTDTTTLTINAIQCNNGNGNNINGFQIGYFLGTCNGLIPYGCTAGVGGTVQFESGILPSGTIVYVAIDGYSGSNCAYQINVTNSAPPLGIDTTTDIQSLNNQIKLINPVRGLIKLPYKADVKMYATDGRLVLSKQNTDFVDVRHLALGYYFVIIQNRRVYLTKKILLL